MPHVTKRISLLFSDCGISYAFTACPSKYPSGYIPAASGAPKAYKMLYGRRMNFADAKRACYNEGSVLAMPRTEQDISDIKKFNRE